MIARLELQLAVAGSDGSSWRHGDGLNGGGEHEVMTFGIPSAKPRRSASRTVQSGANHCHFSETLSTAPTSISYNHYLTFRRVNDVVACTRLHYLRCSQHELSQQQPIPASLSVVSARGLKARKRAPIDKQLGAFSGFGRRSLWWGLRTSIEAQAVSALDLMITMHIIMHRPDLHERRYATQLTSCTATN